MENPFYKYLTKEDHLHIACWDYLKFQYPQAFTVHVPSEGKRSPFERYKAKMLGLTKGVSDILIFEPRNGYNGLAIELKWGENKPSEDQYDVLEKLANRGWKTMWLNNFDDFKKEVDTYFYELKKFEEIK